MDITCKALAICCLSAGILTACSSDDDDSVSTPEANDPSAKYQGSYAIACTSNGTSGSSTSLLSVTGLAISRTDTEYSDDQCVTPTNTVVLTADISFPGGTQTTDHGDADHIDVVTTGVTEDGAVLDLSTVPATELTDFTIAALEGGNLYLGDTDADGVGDSAETRPTTLEQVPFVRQ